MSRTVVKNKNRLRLSRAILLIISVILFSNPTFALPNDQQKILHLSADSADINQKNHKGIYIGHVELDQGSTHLRAAEATTVGNSKNQLIKAIAKGSQTNQAHYWTLTAEDKPPLHAYADTIYYYPERHVIELIGHAKITQGESSFSAPKIIYDTKRQHVLTKKTKQERTTIIYYPEKKS